MSAKCRSCGAAILWVKTQSGKSMPVDAQPCEDGNVCVATCEGGPTAFVPPEGTTISDATRHKSHFATCPNAATHRKPKVPALPMFDSDPVPDTGGES